MRNEKWVWFDMDGTIADLYGVENWLDDLLAHNTRPYEKANDIYNMYELLGTMMLLKENGYNLGIISWGSKENNVDYDKAVEKAKREWLAERLIDKIVDEIIVTPYGVRKADTCRQFGYGILVDDEEQNRNAWDLGSTINANENILKILKSMLDK